MSGFEQLLALQPVAPGQYRAQIPDAWQQGRGAFGGLVGALLLRATHAHMPPTPVRSVTAQFFAPAMVGAAELLVTVQKVGSNVAVASVVMMQAGAAVANATIVRGGERATPLTWNELAPPVMKPFDACAAMPRGVPFAPVFTQHFDYRPTGPLPFSGGTSARCEGWIAVRKAGAADGEAAISDELVLAYADAYWTAAMVKMQAPRPAATVSFALQYGHCGASRVAQPLYLRAHTPYAAGGYVTEFRELWTASGELVATNQQVIAIIA
ncbi:MAG: thioesterase family protein [Myxococcales bacterium]|nr:thioesterase family protein [Myxococcales bacterium]